MEKEMLKQLENLNKEYEKLKDNFKFSNLFLEDSIDKNVMFLFSKYFFRKKHNIVFV